MITEVCDDCGGTGSVTRRVRFDRWAGRHVPMEPCKSCRGSQKALTLADGYEFMLEFEYSQRHAKARTKQLERDLEEVWVEKKCRG